MAEQNTQPSGSRNFQLNLVQVADLSCRILYQTFVVQKKDKAKQALKELKTGKGTNVGVLTLTAKHNDTGAEEKLELPMKLKLDYSEFRGPFNFPSFEASVRATISLIGQTLDAKGDLNILTDETTGSALLHLPGVIQDENGRFNVMVMAIEPIKERERKLALGVKLMYLDPDQYDQLRKDDTPVVESDGAESDGESDDKKA